MDDLYAVLYKFLDLCFFFKEKKKKKTKYYHFLLKESLVFITKAYKSDNVILCVNTQLITLLVSIFDAIADLRGHTNSPCLSPSPPPFETQLAYLISPKEQPQRQLPCYCAFSPLIVCLFLFCFLNPGHATSLTCPE